MRHALLPALLLAVCTAALAACGASDSPSASTAVTARLGSTVQTKTVESSASGKSGGPGTTSLSDETTRLKDYLARHQSTFGQTMASLGAGLSSGTAALQTEAERTRFQEHLKLLEAEATQAQARAHSTSDEEFVQHMRDLIRDIQEKLAAMQAAQGDAVRPTGRT